MAARIFRGLTATGYSEHLLASSLKMASFGINGAQPLVYLSIIGTEKSNSLKTLCS